MANIGYIRVSSVDQNTARQLDGLTLDMVFVEKASGKDTQRPKLQSLLKTIKAGDTVFCHSMDRLARNLQDLLHLVEEINGKQASIKFIKESLEFQPDNTNPMSVLLLQLLGAVAQFERALILERQKEGIAKAKEKGVYKGRKPLDKEIIASAKVLSDSGIPLAKVAKQLGVGVSTLYKYAQRKPSGYKWKM